MVPPLLPLLLMLPRKKILGRIYLINSLAQI
jgi:hypothetical protein